MPRRSRGDGGLVRRCSVADCEGVHDAQGLCRVHYRRAKRRGELDNLPVPSIQERFWIKVEKTETCWLWTASLAHGYGHFGLAAGDNRYAHRLAYEWLVGPIPQGMQLDHLCRVRRCCNPEHLEVVEPGENYRRGVGFSGVNHRKVGCPQGHAYDEANTYVDPRGQRHCRTCRRERRRDWRARRAAA